MFRRSLPRIVSAKDGRVASSHYTSLTARVTTVEAGAVIAEYVILIAGVVLIGLSGLLLLAASRSRAFNQAGDTTAVVSIADSGAPAAANGVTLVAGGRSILGSPKSGRR